MQSMHCEPALAPGSGVPRLMRLALSIPRWWMVGRSTLARTTASPTPCRPLPACCVGPTSPESVSEIDNLTAVLLSDSFQAGQVYWCSENRQRVGKGGMLWIRSNKEPKKMTQQSKPPISLRLKEKTLKWRLLRRRCPGDR